MTLIAGIDVGNSTTEIVIANVDGERVEVICNGTVLTQGSKGSDASSRAATHLLERLERENRVAADCIAMARFQPVVTSMAQLPLAAPASGRLAAIAAPAQTPSGEGVASGRYVRLEELPERSRMPLVVSVPEDIDFAEAAARIGAARLAGLPIAGVLCEADEAVLVGNRLLCAVPIIDEVPLAQLVPGELLLLEVAPPGGHVQALADPVTLAHLAGLPAEAVGEAVEIAARNTESRVALVRRKEASPDGTAGEPAAWLEYEASGEVHRLCLATDYRERAAAIRPGLVRALQLPSIKQRGSPPAPDTTVRDLFAPDLQRIARQPFVRRGSVDVQSVPLSILREGTPQLSSPRRLSRLFGRPVVVEVDEPLAAFRGAMTTPGVPADAVVCDIGAGTISVTDGSGSVTAAGAGDLLTLSTALMLDISVSLAERAKRHTSVRALTPHLIHDENGDQRFIDHPIRGDAVGMLCADTSGSLLPFATQLAPEEWRSLRLSLKMEVVGMNVARALRALGRKPPALLLCGGGALDRELLRCVADILPWPGVAVGRADMAGALGPRYAVAFGLVLTRARASSGAGNSAGAPSQGGQGRRQG